MTNFVCQDGIHEESLQVRLAAMEELEEKAQSLGLRVAELERNLREKEEELEKAGAEHAEDLERAQVCLLLSSTRVSMHSSLYHTHARVSTNTH